MKVNENHEYLDFKGNVINKPSVSTIISYVFGNQYSKVNPYVLKKAAKRGNNVHHYLDRYAKENKANKPFPLLFLETEKVLAGLLRDDFEMLANGHDYGSELSLESEMYVGTIDLLLAKDGKLILIDYKTTRETSFATWALQLSLYADLVNNAKVFGTVDKCEVWHVSYNQYYKKKRYSFVPGANLDRDKVYQQIKELWELGNYGK